MEAVQGWYDPKTKECGKFNKKGQAVHYNWFDKILNWFRKRRWDFEYERIKRNYFEYRDLITWEDGSSSPCYINHYIKGAYVWHLGHKWLIDYYALTQDNRAIKTALVR